MLEQINFVQSERTYEVNIPEEGIMLVFTLLLMFDQMHDFGENSSRNNLSDIPLAMEELRNQIFKFINKHFSGFIKRQERFLSEKEKKLTPDQIKAKERLVKSVENLREGKIKDILKNKYKLSSDLLDYLGIYQINFETLADRYFSEFDSIGCSEAVDVLRYFLDFIRTIDGSPLGSKNNFIFVDAYKSNIRISPLLYNLCDLIFSPFRIQNNVELVKSIGTLYDSATDPGTEKYIDRLIETKEHKLNKLEKELIQYPENELLKKQIESLKNKNISIAKPNTIRKNKGETKYTKKYIINFIINNKAVRACEFDLSIEEKNTTFNLDENTIEDLLKKKRTERATIYDHFMKIIKNELLGYYPDEVNPNVTRINQKLGIKICSKSDFTTVQSDDEIEKKRKKLQKEKEKLKEEERIQDLLIKNNNRKKKVLNTLEIWKEKIKDHVCSTNNVEVIKANVIEWFGLKKILLQTAKENLYPEGENIDTISVNYITEVINKNHKGRIGEMAPYYFPYKTIGDFAQILDCYHFRKLNPNRVSPIFLTFDRIAAYISSMFNRTIFESQSKQDLISLETFISDNEMSKFESLNRLELDAIEGIEGMNTEIKPIFKVTGSAYNSPAISRVGTPIKEVPIGDETIIGENKTGQAVFEGTPPRKPSGRKSIRKKPPIPFEINTSLQQGVSTGTPGTPVRNLTPRSHGRVLSARDVQEQRFFRREQTFEDVTTSTKVSAEELPKILSQKLMLISSVKTDGELPPREDESLERSLVPIPVQRPRTPISPVRKKSRKHSPKK